MKVLVTGGAGFIGSHVAEAARDAGHAVSVVDDLSSGRRDNVPEGIAFHQVDIRDRSALDRVLDDFRPDAISHHAAQASVAVSVREPVLDAAVNIIGSIHVLEAARRHGSRLIFASTGGALYGEVPDGEVATTATAPNPLSPYACSKLAFEQYLQSYGAAFGVPYTVLRYANVYGPRQDPHGEAGVVAIFLQRLLSGDAIQINARSEAGDAGCVRDYVYVKDVVAANLMALEGIQSLHTINVGTGIGTTTRQLANLLTRLTGSESDMHDAPPRAGDLQRSVLDPTALRRIVSEPLPLETGLRDTLAWFKTRRGQTS